jgi:hypothetical protein
LRLVTPRQNILNHPRSILTTPYLGVYVSGAGRKSYYTLVRNKGLTYRIGSFETPEEAKEAHRRLLKFVIGKQASILAEL